MKNIVDKIKPKYNIPTVIPFQHKHVVFCPICKRMEDYVSYPGLKQSMATSTMPIQCTKCGNTFTQYNNRPWVTPHHDSKYAKMGPFITQDLIIFMGNQTDTDSDGNVIKKTFVVKGETTYIYKSGKTRHFLRGLCLIIDGINKQIYLLPFKNEKQISFIHVYPSSEIQGFYPNNIGFGKATNFLSREFGDLMDILFSLVKTDETSYTEWQNFKKNKITNNAQYVAFAYMRNRYPEVYKLLFPFLVKSGKPTNLIACIHEFAMANRDMGKLLTEKDPDTFIQNIRNAIVNYNDPDRLENVLNDPVQHTSELMALIYALNAYKLNMRDTDTLLELSSNMHDPAHLAKNNSIMIYGYDCMMHRSHGRKRFYKTVLKEIGMSELSTILTNRYLIYPGAYSRFERNIETTISILDDQMHYDPEVFKRLL